MLGLRTRRKADIFNASQGKVSRTASPIARNGGISQSNIILFIVIRNLKIWGENRRISWFISMSNVQSSYFPFLEGDIESMIRLKYFNGGSIWMSFEASTKVSKRQ